MSGHKWSEDEVDFFVHLYRNHECLWNPQKPSHYTNIEMRRAAFANIELKMLQRTKVQGFGEELIKAKIFSLRTKYFQIQKQYKHSSFGLSELAGNWYLDMDHMVKYSKKYMHEYRKILPLMNTEQQGSETSNSHFFECDENSQDEEMDEEDNNESALVSSVKIQGRVEIMNVIKKLYISKVTQSYKIVFDILTKVIQNTDRSLISCEESCRREMTKLGYMFKETIDGKKIIIEDAELRFERYLYLSKIRQLRAKRKPIIYIDERIINLQLKFEKLCLEEGLPPDSFIMFLALTNEGPLSCLCSSQATKEHFKKWVTDILLGLIKVPSVIIMDNSPIHGKMEDTCQITKYSTKNEMLKWLSVNNIPCSPNIARPHLFELIRLNKNETKEYKIDRLIRSHGHEVLRLPKTFSDLTMSDIFWNTMADHNNTKIIKGPGSSNSLQMLQVTFTDKLLPSISKKKWSDMENALLMKENDVYQIDTAIESVLETYTFM